MNIYRIKDILRDKGVTYEALGEKIGLTKTSVSRIANGDQQPKPKTLIAISKALDVDIRELFVSTKGADTPEEALRKIKEIAEQQLKE